MSSITQLTAKTPSPAVELTPETSRVITLVVLLEFIPDFSDSALSFYRLENIYSIAIDNFFRSL
jgi:hypothetical protein